MLVFCLVEVIFLNMKSWKISLLSALLFWACADQNADMLGGVIITTNTSPSAKIYVYEQGHPEKILDSAQSSSTGTELKNLDPAKTYVVWLSEDSLHGALAAEVKAGTRLNLQAQNYRWLSQDSAYFGQASFRGYLGRIQSRSGILHIPVLGGAVEQLWKSEAGELLSLRVSGDSAQLNWKKQIRSVPLDLEANISSSLTQSSSLQSSSSMSSSSSALSSSGNNGASGGLTDTRDQRVYATVKIGKAYWFAENMQYALSRAAICPDQNSLNCSAYGALYTWTEAQSICPTGSHLPDSSEFAALMQNCGGVSSSTNLRSTSWTGGTDQCGFNALAAGEVTSLGYASNFGRAADFWVKGNNSAGFPMDFFVVPAATAPAIQVVARDDYRSVRCVKD